jgi:hypothetical protein
MKHCNLNGVELSATQLHPTVETRLQTDSNGVGPPFGLPNIYEFCFLHTEENEMK